jgi:adenosylcobinamide-GDP ribazoletransferase
MADNDPNAPSPESSSAGGVLAAWWHDVRVAGRFLTRLPFDREDGLGPIEAAAEEFEEGEMEEGALALATRAFPLVGVGIGAAGGLAFAVAEALGLPSVVSALLALAATISITGALHEDGLADVADGLGGGRDRDARLVIMRDTRTGVFGVLGLVLSVGLRVGALAAMGSAGAAAAALMAAGAGSRAVLPVVMERMDPARPLGLGAAAGKPPKDRMLTAAVLGAVLVLLFLGPVGGAIAVLVGAGAAAALAALLYKQLGGYTGDVLGAEQQVTEIAILLTAVAVS